MSSFLSRWSLAFLLTMLGCGEEPTTYSQVIAIKLSGIKPGDIEDMQASEEKNVNSEEGNPYADFLRQAAADLGRAPGSIGVHHATVRIFSDTRGVNGLEEVFDDLEVFISTSSTTIALGTVDNPQGTSVEVPITATREDLASVQENLLGGDLKVGVRGATVAVTPEDFELKLSVEIQFEAYR